MILRFWGLSKLACGSIKMVAAGLLGGATLCWVAASAGPTTARVIVHVTEADVRVEVGGFQFEVGESSLTPIVCRIPAGEHQLVMTRGATELHSETFMVGGGEEVVLTAWRSLPASGSRSRPVPPIR